MAVFFLGAAAVFFLGMAAFLLQQRINNINKASETNAVAPADLAMAEMQRRNTDSLRSHPSTLSIVSNIFQAALYAWIAVRLNRKARQTARAEQGLCIACGYDVRATPERCPECGTVPKRVDKATA